MARLSPILEDLHTRVGYGPLREGLVYLNNVEVVEGLVRSFLADVIKRFTATIDDDDEQAASRLLTWIESESVRYNDIFLGKDKEYGVSLWNQPDQIGRFVAKRMRIKNPPEEAVKAAFYETAGQLIEMLPAMTDQPESEWKWKIDALADTLSRALAGLPSGDDDDPDIAA